MGWYRAHCGRSAIARYEATASLPALQCTHIIAHDLAGQMQPRAVRMRHEDVAGRELAIFEADHSSPPLLKIASKYLNNVVEQDHRAIKRITRPMLGFKSFRCACILLAGIELMHMIRKGQLGPIKDRALSAANQFSSLAF